MEVKSNRERVIQALKESPQPMGLRDVMAATGLRRAVVTGCLYRLRDVGCVEVQLTQAGYSQFKFTGKEDRSNTRILQSPRKRPRKSKDNDMGVELMVRVLDSKGQILELTLAQALEVEKQLSALRKQIGAAL